MGNRRIGRKRLYGVEKAGQKVDLEAGAGVSSAIVSATQHRQGQEIITEIALDLGGSSMAGGTADEKIIGSGASKAGHITRLTTAKYGIITEIRAVVVEALVAGPSKIDLWLHGSALNAQIDVTNGSEIGQGVNSGTDYSIQDLATLGQDVSISFDAGTAGNTSATNAYLYMANGTSASNGSGTYTSGKLLIYIHGFVVPADA